MYYAYSDVGWRWESDDERPLPGAQPPKPPAPPGGWDNIDAVYDGASRKWSQDKNKTTSKLQMAKSLYFAHVNGRWQWCDGNVRPTSVKGIPHPTAPPGGWSAKNLVYDGSRGKWFRDV